MSQPDIDFDVQPTVVKATLTALPHGDPVKVHFNPASLVYTVENSSPQQGDPSRRQFAAIFTGKLTMDLQFDTTGTGADVRQATNQVALFMQSSAAANKKDGKKTNKPAPSVLSFDWGAYHFQGFMESFKETIDFFSADGIPLRALVSIGLARQDNVFDAGSDSPTDLSGSLVPTAGSASSDDQPDDDPSSNGVSTTHLATRGGDPNAARALASANNLENPRFTGGASLEVGGGIQLNAAVGFVASASVGGGIGISGGTGIGVSGGLGLSLGASVGTSAGFGLSGGAGAGLGLSAGGGTSGSASAGFSLGVGVSVSSTGGSQVTLAPGGGALFGSKASAGVPATMGAFAGLETGRVTLSTTVQLDPLRMLPATVGSDVLASGGASFGLGGVALTPPGFSADVGAKSTFSARLMFDGD